MSIKPAAVVLEFLEFPGKRENYTSWKKKTKWKAGNFMKILKTLNWEGMENISVIVIMCFTSCLI